MKYKHIFFDLDHTLWDFEANAYQVLQQLYNAHNLEGRGVPSFEQFHRTYMVHNDKLWDRFRKGFITRHDLRTKRFRRLFFHMQKRSWNTWPRRTILYT